MSSKSHSWGNAGFTLIETVMAVAITAVVGLFLTGFISSHLNVYIRCDETLSAKMMCSQAYAEIEMELRYAYVYYTDPMDTGLLRYYVRPEEPLEARDRFGNLKLPAPSAWPGFSASDLKDISRDGMHLELDFKDSSPEEAHIRMTVVTADGEKGERVLYRQDVVIPSLYHHEVRKETADEQD